MVRSIIFYCFYVIYVLCPAREKLVPLVSVELRDNRVPAEKLVHQDLLDQPEQGFVKT